MHNFNAYCLLWFVLIFNLLCHFLPKPIIFCSLNFILLSNLYTERKKVIPAPAPAPPPPPPPPPPAPVEAKNTDTMKSTKSSKSLGLADPDMQDELKAVLTLYQQRRNHLDIKKTPDIFIHQGSNPDEVQRWLEAKGFSNLAVRKMRMPGHELFSLTRAQVEILLGPDEGRRLYSQVLVQRNVSGYKTTTASELQSILKKVREKVEVN